MRGSNGLAPIVNVSARAKCPDSPTKKKFLTSDEAWTEAHKRSEEAGVDIAPYACAGCGAFHLTRKVNGSDVLTRQDGGKVVTGAQRRKGRNHPVFARPVERVTLPEPESTEPPIPGNRDARLKALRAWLEDGREPTTKEVADTLSGSVARDTVRDLMRSLGYRNTGGRSARWVRKDGSGQERPQAAAQATNEAWHDVAPDRVAHIAVGDLLAAYAAIGWDIRIEVRPRG